MKVLLIGNGAREHAIAKRLAEDSELYVVMSKKNPAIAKLCKAYWICDIEDPAAVLDALEDAGMKFDLGFASPDAVLAAGVSDALATRCAKIASPSKAASRIEWDKGFMRSLMEKYKIGGSLRHKVVNDEMEALRTMEEFGSVAIKPLGLTGGKGVKVSGDHFKTNDEGMEYIRSLLAKDGMCLIEEKAEGEEFSYQCFSDGSRIIPMQPVQDHKRAFERDLGPNTGGMGSYSSGRILPFLTEEDILQADTILEGVVQAMKKEGTPFKGVLYGQFMAGPKGVKVIEFNARFGDPEAMNVLAVLEGSNTLSRIFLSIADGKLAQASPKFSHDCTVVKYLVPDGYPEKSLKDRECIVDEAAIQRCGAEVYYAAVYEGEQEGDKGKVLTTGSRAFGILGRGKTLVEAEAAAEKACAFVTGPLWHRKDIGTAALVQKRVDHMKELRGTKK